MTNTVKIGNYCLGKKPAQPGAIKLSMVNYFAAKRMPEPPPTFGEENLVTGGFPMLMNDKIGNCLVAGGDHETQIFTASGGHQTTFSDDSSRSDYLAITGYDPNDLTAMDEGADASAVFKYRRQTGLLDANGNRHKIGAYATLDPGNLRQLYTAIWIFGAVGIGINFPNYAMDQFDAGGNWEISHTNTKIEGGHYIPGVAKRVPGYISVVSWGKVILMSEAFYKKYSDEVVVCLSEETLTNGLSVDGFNLVELKDDLVQVTRQ